MAIAVALWPRLVGAWEYVPVYNGSLLGGQYFFKGSRGNLNANAALLASPIFKLDNGWSLVPIYSGNYQGTKAVTDGVGAGTLFQQRMDHRVSLTGIFSPPELENWKLKPSASYKREFLKETRDESWGHGLFDYEKIAVGLAAEKVYREPFSYSVALDVYRIRFPNYQSLESNAGTDPQGNPLGRELSSRNVLDTYNFQGSANLSLPIPFEQPKVSLQLGYSFLYQDFIDQRVVDSRGQFGDAQRYDQNQTLSASVTYPRPIRIGEKEFRLGTGFGVSASYNISNQNTFDATATQFVPDAYSYVNFSAGPNFSLSWGPSARPGYLNLSLRGSRTQYQGRLARQGSGTYTSQHQYQDYYTASLSYLYPIAPNLSLKAQTEFFNASSNNAYEKTYSYTYRTASYMMGVVYDY